MNQIGSMFLVGTMGILGGIPTLYILISLPVILVQKIFGKNQIREIPVSVEKKYGKAA